jgi:hypothetical protein
MSTVSTLVDKVRSVQADNIELPVLRDLVKRVQEIPPEQLRCEDRMWTDTGWRQWRQHTSHNPW